MADPTTSGDRWLVVSDVDHRGIIVVVAIICCAYVPMILALRGVITRRDLGVDDWLAVAASVTGVLQYVMVFVAVSHGLGQTYDEVSESDAKSIGNMTIAANVLFFLTVALTKASVVVLCRRLFTLSMKKQLLLCDALVGICALWAIGSILGVTIQCSALEQIGYRTSFCTSMTTRWTAIAIFDGITEIAIFVLAVIVVKPLQMAFDRKVTVILSFAPRLIIIILVGLHVQAIQNTIDSATPDVDLSTPTTYQQVQLIFAIVTAALPALHRWLRKFNTSMGSTWMQTTMSQGHSALSGDNQSRSKRDIPLKSLNASQLSKNHDRVTDDDLDEIHDVQQPVTFRPDQSFNNTSAYRTRDQSNDTDAHSGSHESVSSEAKIIRKDVDWHVRYESMANGLTPEVQPVGRSTGSDYADN